KGGSGKGAKRARGAWIGARALAQRGVVQLGPKYRLCRLERIAANGGLSPSHHLRVEPGRLRGIGPSGLLPPNQEVASALAYGAVGRNLETTVKRALDDIGGNAHVLRLRENARRLGAVFRMLDEFGGTGGGADQGGNEFRIFLRPTLPDRKHLLRRAHQNVRGEMQDLADAEIDRDRIPRRTDAEGVHVSLGKAVHHVRRRQHHEPDILVRIDPTRRHPESQLILVGGKRKG